jgi:lysophospholipase
MINIKRNFSNKFQKIFYGHKALHIIVLINLLFFYQSSIAYGKDNSDPFLSTTPEILHSKYERFQRLNTEHIFFNKSGQEIFWVSIPGKKDQRLKGQKNSTSNLTKGTIVFSPGRSESRLSYYELALFFHELGYNIAIIEHKGQGKSFRYVKNSDVGHIHQFDEYSQDFSIFLIEVKKQFEEPLYLWASSMGAAIALFDPAQANKFNKIILVAPMFEINTRGIPILALDILLNIMRILRGPETYAPLVGPFDPKSPFEKNEYAASRERFNLNKYLYTLNPNLCVGGPSVGWVQSVLRIQDTLRSKISLIRPPVLIFQSDNDKFVISTRQNEFCKLMHSCRITTLSGSMHALHLDTNTNISRMVNSSVRFLSNF